ncbi:hypothetical protein BKA81DRAFT_228724 [Phyllosticta paracitricarpa]
MHGHVTCPRLHEVAHHDGDKGLGKERRRAPAGLGKKQPTADAYDISACTRGEARLASSSTSTTLSQPRRLRYTIHGAKRPPLCLLASARVSRLLCSTVAPDKIQLSFGRSRMISRWRATATARRKVGKGSNQRGRSCVLSWPGRLVVTMGE